MKGLFLLGFVGLAACGEAAVGEDVATFCVTDEAWVPGHRRVVAAYYLAEPYSPVPRHIEVIDDVAVEDGRACLTLRPPSAALLAEAYVGRDMGWLLYHDTRSLERFLQVRGWPIDVLLYEDRNQSGQLEPARPDAPSPDLILADWFGTNLFWLYQLSPHLARLSAYQLEQVLETLPPGHRPYALALTGGIDFARPRDVGASTVRWEERSFGDWGVQRSGCPMEGWHGLCLGLDHISGDQTFLMMDPRIPAHHRAPLAADTRLWTFDPRLPLPVPEGFAAETFPPVVDAVICYTYGPYLLGYDDDYIRRTNVAACQCDFWSRERLVVTLSDDPPDWFLCETVIEDEEWIREESARSLAVGVIDAEQAMP